MERLHANCSNQSLDTAPHQDYNQSEEYAYLSPCTGCHNNTRLCLTRAEPCSLRIQIPLALIVNARRIIANSLYRLFFSFQELSSQSRLWFNNIASPGIISPPRFRPLDNNLPLIHRFISDTHSRSLLTDIAFSLAGTASLVFIPMDL